MSAYSEVYDAIKLANPTLRTGSEEEGYTDLSADEYESQISAWTSARIAQEQAIADEKALVGTKASAIAKLGSLTYVPLTKEEAATIVI